VLYQQGTFPSEYSCIPQSQKGPTKEVSTLIPRQYYLSCSQSELSHVLFLTSFLSFPFLWCMDYKAVYSLWYLSSRS
jgi:hypothetical protein